MGSPFELLKTDFHKNILHLIKLHKLIWFIEKTKNNKTGYYVKRFLQEQGPKSVPNMPLQYSLMHRKCLANLEKQRFAFNESDVFTTESETFCLYRPGVSKFSL